MQIYVSDRFKFIYIRQPKSSSSSILATIQDIFCGSRVCTSHEFMAVPDGKVPDETWNDYFVWTAVRNPIARMVSTYNMFKRYLRTREETSEEPGEYCYATTCTFNDFAHDVVKLRTICDTASCCTYVPEGVHKYLVNMPNAHINQQVHCILTPDGRSLVDYIARCENLEDDWKEVLEAIASRSGRIIDYKPLVHVNTFTSTQTLLPPGEFNAGQAVADVPRPPCISQDVANMGYLNESTVLALSRTYAMDLVLLGFMP